MQTFSWPPPPCGKTLEGKIIEQEREGIMVTLLLRMSWGSECYTVRGKNDGVFTMKTADWANTSTPSENIVAHFPSPAFGAVLAHFCIPQLSDEPANLLEHPTSRCCRTRAAMFNGGRRDFVAQHVASNLVFKYDCVSKKTAIASCVLHSMCPCAHVFTPTL